MAPKKKYSPDEMFNIYLTLGETRTLNAVADITGYSLASINNYSRKYSWISKIKNMLEQDKTLLNAYVTDLSTANIISENIVYAGLGSRILEVLKESLPLLEASKNPKDLKTLLDIYRLLNSQPTEITQTNTKEYSSEDLSKLSDEQLELLQQLN